MIHIEHLYTANNDSPKSIMVSVIGHSYVFYHSICEDPAKIPTDKGKWRIKYKQ